MDKPKELNIELGEKEAEGIYANFVVINHSGAEFVIDFTRLLPGVHKAKVFSRIIMTPQHCKAFAEALNKNLKRFEEKHGKIELKKNQSPEKNFGFKATSESKNDD